MWLEHRPIGIALAVTVALALAPARSSAVPGPAEATLLARTAFIELGVPRPKPTPAESVLALMPHPWPGVAMLVTTTGLAIPILIGSGTRTHQPDDPNLMLGLASFVVLPAVGHLYGGVARRAIPGLALRAGGYGLLAAISGGFSQDFDEGDILAGLAGVSLMAIGGTWDLFTVASHVERANLDRANARLGLTSGWNPATGAPVVAVRVTF